MLGVPWALLTSDGPACQLGAGFLGSSSQHMGVLEVGVASGPWESESSGHRGGGGMLKMLIPGPQPKPEESAFLELEGKLNTVETSLVVQRLRLLTSKARSPGSIPSQGTRSHLLQLRPRTVNKYMCVPSRFSRILLFETL